MAEANGCELTGVIASLEPTRYTPGGVPRRRFWLEHRSRQDEDGAPREARLRMAVILVGEYWQKHGPPLREGGRVRVEGFLARAGWRGEARDRIQLQARSLKSLD
jgi:primosomal replication protein N